MSIKNALSNGVSKFITFLKNPVKGFKNLSSNGKLVFALVTLLVLVSLGSLLFLFNDEMPSPEKIVNDFETKLSTLTPLNAKVTRTDGNVSYKTNESDWQDAGEETELTTENELKTEGAASRTIVSFEDGSEIRLDGDSHVRFDSVSDEKIEVYIVSGRVYARVNTDARPFKLVTQDAEYESKGTVFIAESSGDRQALEVIESLVLETRTNKEVGEGNRYTVISNTNPADNKKIERIDIESYKTQPFIVWNLAIDKANDEYKNKLGFLSDIDPPKITIQSPKNDEVILTEPSSNTGSVTIKGSAQGASTVEVIAKSVSGAPTIKATLKDNGDFEAGPIDSPLGLSVFQIVAKDRAGNTSETSLRVTVQQKSAPAEETSGSEILLKSAVFKDGKMEVTLTWYMSSGVNDANVRILYSKVSNPTLGSNDGVWTPTKGATPPGTISNTFDSGGLDNETYYFRMCELNETQTDCDVYSNTMSVVIAN